MAYPVYSQHDPRWAKDQLGDCQDQTIASAGCYVCSFAMLASSLGQVVLPSSLNNLFTRRSLYVNGCDCTDDVLQRLARATPGSTPWEWMGTYAPPAGQFDKQQLHSNPGQAAILGLHAYGHQHFVTVVSWDGTTCLIGDPELGKVVNLQSQYGWPALFKLVRYQLIPPAIPAPAPQNPEQEFVKRVKQALADLGLSG